MNLERARSEPFARFLDFENRFDDEFKIAVAAMTNLESRVAGDDGPEIMRGIMRDTGDLYREQELWTDPVGKLTRARAAASLLGIVQIHSAIDDFLVQLEAERDRWLHLTGQPPAGQEEEGEEADEEDAPPPKEKMERACERLDLSVAVASLQPIKPLLRAYRGIRNCVAHRSGMTTTAVADLIASVGVTTALAAWPLREGAPALTMPSAALGEPLQVDPRHVIFCLALAHRAVSNMNRAFLDLIGAEGLVCLAARHTLLGGAIQGRNGVHGSADAVINDVLNDRYKATEVASEETIMVLRARDLWVRCLEAHRAIQGPAQG